MIAETLVEAAREIDRYLVLLPGKYARHRVEIERLRDCMMAVARKLDDSREGGEAARPKRGPGDAA